MSEVNYPRISDETIALLLHYSIVVKFNLFNTPFIMHVVQKKTFQ